MIKVGVTGGIGSGKSTVCKIWAELGAFILYADDLAKKLMVTNDEIRKKIRNTFGDQAYNKNGQLNRSYLAKKAFREGKVEILNEIVHPAVYEESMKISEKAKESGFLVFVKEAALLLQKGRPKNFDYIIIVTSKLENRIKRVIRRDNIDEQNVIDRIKNQQNFDDLYHLADYIIHNDGSFKQLKAKAKNIYMEILERDNI